MWCGFLYARANSSAPFSASGNTYAHTEDAEMRVVVVVVAICTDLNDVVISTEYCVLFSFFYFSLWDLRGTRGGRDLPVASVFLAKIFRSKENWKRRRTCCIRKPPPLLNAKNERKKCVSHFIYAPEIAAAAKMSTAPTRRVNNIWQSMWNSTHTHRTHKSTYYYHFVCARALAAELVGGYGYMCSTHQKFTHPPI